jgi:hypothetical protein
LNGWPGGQEKIAVMKLNCNEQGQIVRAIMKRFNKQRPLFIHENSIMGKPVQAQQNYGVLLNTLVASLFMGLYGAAPGHRRATARKFPQLLSASNIRSTR